MSRFASFIGIYNFLLAASTDFVVAVIIRNKVDAELDLLLEQATDQNSTYFVESEYLLERLVKCIHRMKEMTHKDDHCPMTFDSWSCWNFTPPGEVITTSCPSFPEMGFKDSFLAAKYCTPQGQWWVHPDTNRSWSNYTSCLDHTDIHFRNYINILTVSGLSISLFALTMSLIIFTIFPCLSPSRVSLHRNMFLSLIMNNIFWITWIQVVLPVPEIWQNNLVSCKMLHIITTYFMISTYFWMLCEGTYLYLILAKIFIQEEDCVKGLKVFGWLSPGVVMLPYCTYRQIYEDEHCWMDMDKSVWFLASPVLLCILVNIYFLINVVRILRKKLLFENNFNRTNNNILMKSARGASILIPIFGLQFLLVPFRPPPGSSLEYAYEVFSSLASSTQGLSVSVLLCFTNPEIVKIIRNRIQGPNHRIERYSVRWTNRSPLSTHVGVQASYPLTTDRSVCISSISRVPTLKLHSSSYSETRL